MAMVQEQRVMYPVWQEIIREIHHRRYIICIPLALAFLIVYFHRMAAGVVSDSLMREFQISRASELGLLTSIYFYTYAVFQLPAGILADYYGPRRTISIAVAIAAIGAIVFGWAPNLGWLYAGRFLVGLGVAFVYINIVKIFAEWFRTREFGTMSGLSAFVGNAGSVLAATPFALLVEAIGWRSSLISIGVFTLVVASYCWLVVRDRPSDLGWPAMTAVEEYEGNIPPQNGQAVKVNIVDSIRMVITNRYTWPPFFVSGASYGVFMTFAGVWGIPYFMQVYGLSKVAAANYMAVTGAGYMLSGPMVGFLSDRIGMRRLPFIFYTGFILSVWLVMTVWGGGRPPLSIMYPIGFLIGVGASGVALTLACAKEVNPPQMTGIATGIVNIGPFIFAALLQPAFGWILDLYWQGEYLDGVKLYPLQAYQSAFWLCAAVLALAFCSALLLKETRCLNIAHELIKKAQ